ncbi:MAG: DUF3500 domain-containing protein [Verrucomicrobia bacterium]|nr:DUF3500 domain-containing protein [Verrucomicrobiota bacterium]MDA1065940.1 DUF3500 domain-containing protein [Verrucomicrobiota bacterium]
MKNKIYLPIVLALIITISSTVSFAAVDAVVQDMQKAANEFLDSLSDELRLKATYPLEDAERMNWHFVPKTGERKGVDLRDLNMVQELKLAELLAASFSALGHEKVQKIQGLESVLYVMEKADHRDPELYYTTIFGTPSATGSWGWRFEGHHLSQNFTVSHGKLLANSPSFWGANPAKVPVGPTTGQRTLKGEEDTARSFVRSLSKKQQAIAIIADDAPKDIYSGAEKEISPLSPPGIKVSQLEKSQIFGLTRIIQEYLSNMPADVASDRWQKLSKAGLENITFAWAGTTEPENKHYYRVQGPTFLIEYDNVQNEGNHIHAVWRDFDGDFGRDILREHHGHSH